MANEKETPRHNAMDTINDLSGGDVNYDVSVALAAVLAGVKEHGKPGSVTLKIKIEPNPKYGESAVTVTPEVECKVPRRAHKKNMRFIDKDNRLVNDDPNQMQFKEIEKSFKGK